MQATFIDVMRHGEPEGSCPEGGTILRGSSDHKLTAKGWLQAQQRCQSIIGLGNNNSSGPWDIIISSPLVRCADFAQLLVVKTLAADKQLGPVIIKHEWREIHYGDWDGKSTAKIWQQQPELMEKMWQAPLEFCAPNGEAVKDFSSRIKQAWSDLLTEFQGKKILLVCHGGVMRVLLQQLLLMAPEGMNRFAIPYAAMSRFRVDHSLSDEGSILNWPSLVAHYGDELDIVLNEELKSE